MRRVMKSKSEMEYIIEHYNRHLISMPEEDMTMEFAIYDILEWMSDNEEFNNVIFDPNINDRDCLNKLLSEKEKKDLIQRIHKAKTGHWKKTIDTALRKFLLNDLYYEDQYDFLAYI